MFLCIFLPSVCYILTIQSLEGYLQRRENAVVRNILIEHPDALYEGRYSVREEINRNLSRFLKKGVESRLGVKTDILVKTRDGQILYPPVFSKQMEDDEEKDFKSLNYVEVAAENYRILNDGLSLNVEVKIRHNSWISDSILIFYVLLAGLILRFIMKRGLRENERKQEEQQDRILELTAQLSQAREQLEGVIAKEEEYLVKIRELRTDKQDLSKDVEGLLEEMDRLETGLRAQRESRETLENELVELKEDLEHLKEKGEKKGKKKKRSDNMTKRFRLLYKNLEFSDRAVEGFSDLTSEFQLKAEEIIHQLNENDELVTVKRKVFGKGGKLNVLEVNYAYSGRLYFQKNAKGKIKVLAVGTKNTQSQDLTYLESVV